MHHQPPPAAAKVLTEQLVRGRCRTDRIDAVRNLNLWGSDLTDVSLVSRMPLLTVCSLSVNHIGSLEHFADCACLEELYLRRNDVADLGQIVHLRGLRKLRVLWLSENPVTAHPLYRTVVVRTLPQLEKLDNTDITDAERQRAASYSSPELERLVAEVRGASRPTSSAASAAVVRPDTSPAVTSTATRRTSMEQLSVDLGPNSTPPARRGGLPRTPPSRTAPPPPPSSGALRSGGFGEAPTSQRSQRSGGFGEAPTSHPRPPQPPSSASSSHASAAPPPAPKLPPGPTRPTMRAVLLLLEELRADELRCVGEVARYLEATGR